jgi:hypothetical protein
MRASTFIFTFLFLHGISEAQASIADLSAAALNTPPQFTSRTKNLIHSNILAPPPTPKLPTFQLTFNEILTRFRPTTHPHPTPDAPPHPENNTLQRLHLLLKKIQKSTDYTRLPHFSPRLQKFTLSMTSLAKTSFTKTSLLITRFQSLLTKSDSLSQDQIRS